MQTCSKAWNDKVNSLVASSKIPKKYKNILSRMLDSDPLKRPYALTKDILK